MSESTATLPARRPVKFGVSLPLSLRFALREMRGGLRGFYVFLACIALGTGTIAAVNSLAAGLSESIRAEGQSLLGGDAAFSLIHRQASQEERAFLSNSGLLSVAATMRAMARTEPGRQTLVELKGVDTLYPLYGDLELTSGQEAQAVLQERNGDRTPALVEPSFLATSGLELGDPFTLGRLQVFVADAIEREPDRLAGGIAFGPRVMIPIDALQESGLVATGSLVRWRYRVAGPDGPLSDEALTALVEAANEAFPSAGWRVETRAQAAPGLRQSIERFAQFLTLVGLTSLAVGGVGVANSVRAYLAKKRQTIATFRALGAPARFVVMTYFIQVLLLAAVGVIVGLLMGAAAPPIAGMSLGHLLPVSALFAIFPQALIIAALYGVMTAVAFAIWPLAGAYAVRPTALFRDEQTELRGTVLMRFLGLSALAMGLLAALAIVAAYDKTLAGLYLMGVGAVFVLLRLVAFVIMAIAKRLPRSKLTILRFAVANIHRRGALTPTVTLSLGLSLTLLVALSLIDGNLRNTLTSRLPAQAPSFFFVDIQDRTLEQFLSDLRLAAPGGRVETQPMLRGRIVSLNGIAAQDWPDTEASWVLRGDRGITYAASVPDSSKVVAGQWWGQNPQTNQVSFDEELAGELGVSIGDTISVNVLGREVEAEITNLRTVEWESLSINFVMVFSPNVFAGAPHAHLATLTLPGEDDDAKELQILGDMSDAFPTVTAIRVKDALQTVNGVVEDLALAIRAASAVTLIAAMLVLAGTLAASHSSRIYDAVILKTLGARRRTVVAAYALEYALLGFAAAAFGLLAGTGVARFVAVDIMELQFVMLPQTAVRAVVLAVLITVSLGLIGTWRALGEPPVRVLRSL